MDRSEAVIRLKNIDIREALQEDYEALDFAIEALQGDFHCPKCGTIVRDGRQYHDLVYRGEVLVNRGDAEFATTTDCNDCIWNTCNYNKIDWEVSEDCISRKQAAEEIKTAATITGWNKFASQEEIVDDVERQLRRLFVGAIESLPPVTPTVSEDCISREGLLKHAYLREGVMSVSVDSIKLAPSVTPTERIGEWVVSGMDRDGDYMGSRWYTCSQCGGAGDKGDNFCKRCGAKMGGDE